MIYVQLRSYALKKLKSNVAQEIEALKSVEKLKHDYIVTFHGYFVHENVVYIVMDYCEVSPPNSLSLFPVHLPSY